MPVTPHNQYVGRLITALQKRGYTDEEIARMGPDQRFDEFCEWHGLLHWGPTLRAIMETARGDLTIDPPADPNQEAKS